MTIGEPIYNYGETVEFEMTFDEGPRTLIGKVYIVDAYGTFEQAEEPSYDIMVENYDDNGQNLLVKHIRESCVRPASQM